MKRKKILALAALIVTILVGVAIARPGGGNSYSGGGGHYSGGSSSGGGGGGGGAGLFRLIIELLFYYPQIGVPILICIVAWFIWQYIKQQRNADWDSGPPVELAQTIELDNIRRVDPNFSKPIFEDFVFRLYAAAHRARHDVDKLTQLAPYLSPVARDVLHRRDPSQVTGVVIGAMRTIALRMPFTQNDPVRIEIEFEANHAMPARTDFVVERWTLARSASARTKKPDLGNYFPCPNCGAPWAAKDSGSDVCASCGQAVGNGRFDWIVESSQLRSVDQRGPTLTEDVPERGTDLPTYRQQGVDARFLELRTQDPSLTSLDFDLRLHLIYDELNKCWAKNDLEPVRGYLTAGLYDYLQYWIDAYKNQKLKNELIDMSIERTEIAKVTRDAFFDAVTVRVWGTGKDFVVRVPEGTLVRGSKLRHRRYSEYWTLVRSAERKGPAQAKPICGNCGAPLEIVASGECVHCGSHITSGEFDWTLAKIEQDDSYRG